MIVCDDRFLNDESMLKTMLRVFEKRIIRILCLRSISWVVSSLSFRREARDVCEDVCCVRKEMRIKNVVCEKDLSSVEFKDFYLLRSILELIVRSLVNIKKKREIYFVDKIQIFFILFYFSNIFLFNLILISIVIFLLEILWDLRLASSKWSFLTLFLLSRIMFMNRR
jgi:hypothetical protein